MGFWWLIVAVHFALDRTTDCAQKISRFVVMAMHFFINSDKKSNDTRTLRKQQRARANGVAVPIEGAVEGIQLSSLKLRMVEKARKSN